MKMKIGKILLVLLTLALPSCGTNETPYSSESTHFYETETIDPIIESSDIQESEPEIIDEYDNFENDVDDPKDIEGTLFYSSYYRIPVHFSGNIAHKILPYTSENLTLYQNKAAIFYTPIDADASKYTVTYESGDDSIVEIDEYGNILTHGVGNTKCFIYLSNGYYTFTCYRDIYVYSPEAPKTFSIKSSINLIKGGSASLSPSTTDFPVTYKSSNEEVAYVKGSTVYGKSKGVAVIEASLESGLKSRCIVNIEAMDAESFSFTESVYYTKPNLAFALYPHYSPVGANSGLKIEYTSTNSKIADVTTGGIVKGIAPGKCDVVCVLENGYTQVVEVNVGDFVYPVSLSLDKEEANIDINETAILVPTIMPLDVNTNFEIKWKSSDKSICKVVNGTITGVSSGKAEITAYLRGQITAKCDVTVSEVVRAVSFTLSESTVYLSPSTNSTHQLTTAILPSNVTDKSITWSSTNSGVAVVDNDGVVKAVASRGSCYIVATLSDGKQAQCTVSISELSKPTSIEISKFELEPFGKKMLEYELLPARSLTDSVRWESSDTTIATVNKYGLVKAFATGTCVITGTLSGGQSGQMVLVVKEYKVEGISLPGSLTVVKGNTSDLGISLLPSVKNIKCLHIISSDSSVASVDRYGCVTGNNYGTCTITVTSNNGLTKTCSVSVIGTKIDATTITFSVESAAITIGETYAFSYTVAPSNSNCNNSVSWFSMDNSIATVDQFGVITGISEGTVVVKGRLPNGYETACTITVN